MKPLTILALILFSSVLGISTSFASPLGVTEEAASSEACKDLGGKFAKINVLPIRKGGATAIDYHKRGLVLKEVPKEGIPFTRMTARGRCYKNGRIPQFDEKGQQVYVAVEPLTGIIDEVANCANDCESPHRFPVEAPCPPEAPPCEPIIKMVDRIVKAKIDKPCPACEEPKGRKLYLFKPDVWCNRGAEEGFVCALVTAAVCRGFHCFGWGKDAPAPPPPDNGKSGGPILPP